MVKVVGLDAAQVRNALKRLRAAKVDIFGAENHHFLLNPALTDTDVLAFERRHRVLLPIDYRRFLTEIGNGGAGPYHGVFPLGEMDSNHGLARWQEQNGFIGLVSEPFPLETEWNDVAGIPPDGLLKSDAAEYERQWKQFEERYWHPSLMTS